MPSDPSKNKPGKSKPTKPGPDSRHSRSRNTTPVSTSTLVTTDPPSLYFTTHIAPLQTPVQTNLEKVLGSDGALSHVPSSVKLNAMQEDIRNDVLGPIRSRGEVLDRVMRELSKKRKERAEQERDRDRANREAEERRHKLKKQSKKHDPAADERPLTVGAHEVAKQDGVDVHKDISSSISSPVSQAPPSAGTAPQDLAPSPSGSEASHQPPPAPAMPQYQTFGPDPSKFNDPTIYHIREVTPNMADDERREIYSVAIYPESDLHDQTCGTPPDKDFSNAKPSTQVTFNQFTNYIDPYVRPLCEEDIAFLKERGDRVTPFMLPPRGPRHYKDIWAEEDNGMQLDADERPPPYEPRGSADQLLTEDLTETDRVSAGPVLSRLLETMRPERRAEEPSTNGETNSLANGDMDLDEPLHSHTNGETLANGTSSIPPAVHMPEADAPGFKAPNFPRPDYATLDDRVLQELRYLGFFGADDAPSYAGHYDDEVAARLRYLQAELKRVSVENGARKARILELTKDRMAQQEYSNIADDLDQQLNLAYLKRNRTIGKGKKVVKRPGGAGGGSHPVANSGAGAITRPGIGEPIRNLMERRLRWRNEIGPVVDYGRAELPKETIFGDDVMKKWTDKEAESWNEVEE